MSDDLDDDLSIDDSFDDFEKKEGGNTLGDLWRDNALFKIGVIAGAGILFFVLISFLGGDEEKTQPSMVSPAADIKAPPGSEGASEIYREAVREINEADVERALQEGDSSLPVPIEPTPGTINVPEEEEEAEDPLQRWRRLQEERLERELQQRETAVPVDTGADQQRAEAIQALAEAMSQQMQSILSTQNEITVAQRPMTDQDFLERLHEQEMEDGEFVDGEFVDEDGDDLDLEAEPEVLFPAGEIAYAQLLTEANTDAPGPVLAEIMSGPLKGNRVLGSFEAQDEYLTLNFDTIVIDGQSLTIDAVALDPDTTLPGMATEVDHRYFKRIVLPAAAAFVEGVSEAVAESGLTTITIEGETVAEETEDADTEQEIAAGLEEVGQELSEILDEIADDTEVLIRVEAGTPFGLLFIEPVLSDPDVETADDF
ncbi:MAG: type IV secretion protein DotG [Alphaproteobacteria bacterium]|nr:type IV secretion protein DotG [Alphaproteobacteria bacterium]